MSLKQDAYRLQRAEATIDELLAALESIQNRGSKADMHQYALEIRKTASEAIAKARGEQ